MQDLETFFSDEMKQFREQIKESMKTYAGLLEEDMEKIKVCPVGDPRESKWNKYTLPGIPDWFVGFWYACVDCIRNLSPLLCLNINRDEDVNSINPPQINSDESPNPAILDTSPTMEDHPICFRCTLARKLKEFGSYLWKVVEKILKELDLTERYDVSDISNYLATEASLCRKCAHNRGDSQDQD